MSVVKVSLPLHVISGIHSTPTPVVGAFHHISLYVTQMQFIGNANLIAIKEYYFYDPAIKIVLNSLLQTLKLIKPYRG